MLRPRTLRILLLLVLLHGLLLMPGLVWDKYLDSPLGILLMLPFLFAQIFYLFGVPGVLQHGGACGWSGCPPTTLGWALAAIAWLVPLWLLAWLIATAGHDS